MIKEVERIHVRFQFLKNQSKQERLLILDNIEQNIGSVPIKNPKEVNEKNEIICYYEQILCRTNSYYLQSCELKNGKYVAIGNCLEIVASMLFDGAVVQLTMPTETVPYPDIDDIIARSTGLIEDSEYRDTIEKLLVANIPNEEFRSKLRVLLLLDEGDKELIIKDFMYENKSLNSSSMSDEFKSFIEKKSDENLGKLKNLFDDLKKSLKSNQEDLKDYISDIVGKIDLRSILDSNSQIKNEISDLRLWLEKWCDTQERLSKKNARAAQEMQDSLKDAIKDSSGYTVSQLKDIFQSQFNKWGKKVNWKLNLILVFLIFFAVIFVIGGLFYFNGKNITYQLFNKFPSEWTAKIAIDKGNITIVSSYAERLEKKGNIAEATKWWKKNIYLMESLLSLSEDEDIKNYALASLSLQYIQGKGCYVNYKKALEYCTTISGDNLGLKSYLYALIGDNTEAYHYLDSGSFSTLSKIVSSLNMNEGEVENGNVVDWTLLWKDSINNLLPANKLLTSEALIVSGKLAEKDGDIYEAYRNYMTVGKLEYTKGYIEAFRLLSEASPVTGLYMATLEDIVERYPSVEFWNLLEPINSNHYKSLSKWTFNLGPEYTKGNISQVNRFLSMAFKDAGYIYDNDKKFITLESIDRSFSTARLVNDSIIAATGYKQSKFDSKFILSKLQALVGEKFLKIILKNEKVQEIQKFPILPLLYKDYTPKDSTYISHLGEYFTLSNIIYKDSISGDMKTFVLDRIRYLGNEALSESPSTDDMFVYEYGKLLFIDSDRDSIVKGRKILNTLYDTTVDNGIRTMCRKVFLMDELRTPILFNQLIQKVLNYATESYGLRNINLEQIKNKSDKQRVILQVASRLNTKQDYDILGILWSYVSLLELSKDKVDEEKEWFYYELSKIGNAELALFFKLHRLQTAITNGHIEYAERIYESDFGKEDISFDKLRDGLMDTDEIPSPKNDFIVLCPYIPK